MARCIRYLDSVLAFPRGVLCTADDVATVGGLIAAVSRDDPWQMVAPLARVVMGDAGDLLQLDPATPLSSLLPSPHGSGGGNSPTGDAGAIDVEIVRSNVVSVTSRGITVSHEAARLLLLEPVVLEAASAAAVAAHLTLALPTSHAPGDDAFDQPTRRRKGVQVAAGGSLSGSFNEEPWGMGDASVGMNVGGGPGGVPHTNSGSSVGSPVDLAKMHAGGSRGSLGMRRVYSSAEFDPNWQQPPPNPNAMGLRVYDAATCCYIRMPVEGAPMAAGGKLRVALEVQPIPVGMGTPPADADARGGDGLDTMEPAATATATVEPITPLSPTGGAEGFVSTQESSPKDAALYALIADGAREGAGPGAGKKPPAIKDVKAAVRRGVPKACIAPLLRHWLLGHTLGGGGPVEAAAIKEKVHLAGRTFRKDFHSAYGWQVGDVGDDFAPLSWGFGADPRVWERANPFRLAPKHLRDVRVLLGMLAHRHGATATQLSYPVLPLLLSYLLKHLSLEEVYCCGNALVSSVHMARTAVLDKKGKPPARGKAVTAGLEIMAEHVDPAFTSAPLDQVLSSGVSAPMVSDDGGVWHWFTDTTLPAVTARLQSLIKAKASVAHERTVHVADIDLPGSVLEWCGTAFVGVLPPAVCERLLLCYFSEGMKVFIRFALALLRESKGPPPRNSVARPPAAIDALFKAAYGLSLQGKLVFGKGNADVRKAEQQGRGGASGGDADVGRYVLARPRLLTPSHIVTHAMLWERIFSWIPLRFLQSKSLKKIYEKNADGISFGTLEAATAKHEAWEGATLILIHAARDAQRRSSRGNTPGTTDGGDADAPRVFGYFLTKGLCMSNFTGRGGKGDLASFGFVLSPPTAARCVYVPGTTHHCIFTASRLALGVEGDAVWADFDGSLDRARSYPRQREGCQERCGCGGCLPLIFDGACVAINAEVYTFE